MQIELLQTSNSYLSGRFCSLLSANGDGKSFSDDRLRWLTRPELQLVPPHAAISPASAIGRSGAVKRLCLPSLRRTSTARTVHSKLYKYKSKQKLQCGRRSVFFLFRCEQASATTASLDYICLVFIPIAILCLCSRSSAPSAAHYRSPWTVCLHGSTARGIRSVELHQATAFLGAICASRSYPVNVYKFASSVSSIKANQTDHLKLSISTHESDDQHSSTHLHYRPVLN